MSRPTNLFTGLKSSEDDSVAGTARKRSSFVGIDVLVATPRAHAPRSSLTVEHNAGSTPASPTARRRRGSGATLLSSRISPPLSATTTTVRHHRFRGASAIAAAILFLLAAVCGVWLSRLSVAPLLSTPLQETIQTPISVEQTSVAAPVVLPPPMCSECLLYSGLNGTKVSVWKNLQYKEKYADLAARGFVDDANARVIIYFAWVFNEWAAEEYSAAPKLVPARFHKNFVWAANSPAERDLLEATFPSSEVVFSPFNALLNENVFTLAPSRAPLAAGTEPTCLINSQGKLWKNHALSVGIPSRVFVTYDIEPGLDMFSFGAKAVHQSIDHMALAVLLAASDYGAIFSTEEGNCRCVV